MKLRKGFTIIELMLAMSFVAVLMVSVAFLIIRVTAIYQKGLTIRSINQVGRNLTSDFIRAVADSPVDDSLSSRDAYYYSLPSTGTQMQGAFCTGKNSYLWNTGTAINTGKRVRFKNAKGTFDFRLLRLDDAGRVACEKLKELGASGNVIDFSTLSGSNPLKDNVPIELLTLSSADTAAGTEAASESDLALYDLRVYAPTINHVTGHAYYSATFILATLRGVDITLSGNYCKNISETLNTDFSYCALNKFNFAMTTTGDTGGKKDDYGDRS
jgi:prepilin-type N-terminal cleavage/methylation domain-containing protein